MTAHADRIRQAEEAAGVYDDTAWEVGDLVREPLRENLPDGIVLVDKDGDPWKLIDGDWCCALAEDTDPVGGYGPYAIVWLPEEDA